MGLLSAGTPLNWKETKNYADHVRREGIKQFLKSFHQLKYREKDTLLWGDEVEYTLILLDPDTKSAQLFLGANDIMDVLSLEEQEAKP
ncbi:unnamed protein product [Protopolystoma xenopodis]|uniref:Glutamate--cysteine ligase n=1 Tax=Protopolystoma xenopodis TaxID=117903 RepID=A0A448X5H6_9PLAT|nr:unnamed protein product [Protopolystoma xenopodis]